MKQFEFILENLDCANCANKIERELSSYDFIKDVNLNFATLKLKFRCEEVDLEKVKDIIDSIEDGLNLIPAEKYSGSNKVTLWELIKIIISILIIISTFFFQNDIGELVLFIISYLIIAYDILIKSVKNILKGKIFDENFLMAFATIGAFAIGDYIEAIAVIVFYSIGMILQRISLSKSRNSIVKMLSSQVKEVKIVKDKTIELRKVEQIEIGDKVLVKPGEKIVVDGIIVEGDGYFDTSLANGESLLKHLEEGDEVYAGYISKNAGVVVEAQKLASESLTSRIAQLVEVASEKKSKSEQFITKFARVYTPIVFFLSALIVIIPSIITKDFETYFYRGLGFLIISCPCALVISIPLSFFAGIGRLSKEGILIKGSEYLEVLTKSGTLILDKTGTITKGEFVISKIVTNNIEDEKLVEIAAHGEYYSSHPLASVILKSYIGEIEVSRIKDFEEISGKGIKTLYQDQELIIGNKKLLVEYGIEIEVEVEEETGSIIFVGLDERLLGYFIFKDVIKDNMVEIVKRFKKNNLKNIYILSGDNEKTVKEVANYLAIENYYASLLPNQKLNYVEDIIAKSANKVIFIGDGINDSPSLKRADIGITMGTKGSDVAIETSDLIILSDNLDKVNSAIILSKFTIRIVKQNIFLSIFIKLLFLTLAALGLTQLWMAIIADVGVTLLVVLNSLRIISKQIKHPL